MARRKCRCDCSINSLFYFEDYSIPKINWKSRDYVQANTAYITRDLTRGSKSYYFKHIPLSNIGFSVRRCQRMDADLFLQFLQGLQDSREFGLKKKSRSKAMLALDSYSSENLRDDFRTMRNPFSNVNRLKSQAFFPFLRQVS